MAKVEILLATFNGGKFLEEQLNSLLNQTFQDLLISIRDDGSKDHTIEIIEKFCKEYPGKVQLSQTSGTRLGSTLSFSKLLEESTADFLMLCDQDDVWKRNKVELTLNEMRRMEAIHGSDIPLLVFTDLEEVDDDLNIISTSFFASQKLFPEISSSATKLAALNVVAGCTIMINRTSVQFCIPIPSTKIVHDQWIAVNVAHYGKVCYIKYATILYRQHSTNAIGSHKVGISYFFQKLVRPGKQFWVYKDLILNLKFCINYFAFFFYKILFTVKRIL